MTESKDRDVARFDRWAPTYDRDRLQARFFRPVHAETLALAAYPGVSPRRVLDIGCGTGAFLRSVVERFPDTALVGVDPALGMLRRAMAAGGGVTPVQGMAEALPFAEGSFDLVTSTVSFHHWADQRRGVKEVGRVLAPGGVFVLADLHAVGWLRGLFALGRSRDRMHTRAEVDEMLSSAGLQVLKWAPVLDFDVRLLLRSGSPRSPRGRIPLVSAVIARRA